MRSTTRALLAGLAVLLLAAPFALANHTPPSLDHADGGKMRCREEQGRILREGAAQDQVLPLLRTTDNGHLVITANGTANVNREMKCLFEVVITGYSLGGVNPVGGLNNVASTPCSATGGMTCTASAEADWWVVFVDALNGTHTREITIHFDLRVDGLTVDSGDVRIVEPSVPALPKLI